MSGPPISPLTGFFRFPTEILTLDDVIDSLDYDTSALPWLRCYGCGHRADAHGWAHAADGSIEEWCAGGYYEDDESYARFVCRCGEFE